MKDGEHFPLILRDPPGSSNPSWPPPLAAKGNARCLEEPRLGVVNVCGCHRRKKINKRV